jgi:Ubiquitin-like modifier-activating enzyme ATG7 N-terminus
VRKSSRSQVWVAFCDPCNLPTHAGWPLRNLLLMAMKHWKISEGVIKVGDRE